VCSEKCAVFIFAPSLVRFGAPSALMGAALGTNCVPDHNDQQFFEKVELLSCQGTARYVCEEVGDACHVAAGATYREVFVSGNTYMMLLAVDEPKSTQNTDNADDLLKLACVCEARSLERLYNEDATAVNLRRAISQMSTQIGAGDNFVFAFSGRRENAGGKGAFCLADSRGDSGYAACWMLDDDFAELITTSLHPKARVSFVLDSCGAAGTLDLWSPSWSSLPVVQLSHCRPRDGTMGKVPIASDPTTGLTETLMMATERLRVDGEVDYSVGKLYATMLLMEGCAKELTAQSSLDASCDALPWPLAPRRCAYRRGTEPRRGDAEGMESVGPTRTPSDSSSSQVSCSTAQSSDAAAAAAGGRSSERRAAERRAARLAAHKASQSDRSGSKGRSTSGKCADASAIIVTAAASHNVAEADAGSERKAASKCPVGHSLEAFHPPVEGYSCSRCSRIVGAGVGLFGCRRCDFDLCQACCGEAVEGGMTSEEGEVEDEDDMEKILTTITEEELGARGPFRQRTCFEEGMREDLPMLLGSRSRAGSGASGCMALDSPYSARSRGASHSARSASSHTPRTALGPSFGAPLPACSGYGGSMSARSLHSASEATPSAAFWAGAASATSAPSGSALAVPWGAGQAPPRSTSVEVNEAAGAGCWANDRSQLPAA